MLLSTQSLKNLKMLLLLYGAAISPSVLALTEQECLTQTIPVFSLSKTAVNQGETVDVNWEVTSPLGCGEIFQRISGPGFNGAEQVDSSGSRTVNPWGTAEFTLTFKTLTLAKTRTVRKQVQVNLPIPPDGSPYKVTISQNDQRWLFKQAVGVPNAEVAVAGDVSLDLTGFSNIFVADGVKIIGERSRFPRGPLLFTRAFPAKLFVIGSPYSTSDNVKIEGVRIKGPQTNSADSAALAADGIYIYPGQNIEIADNEIFGFRGSAIDIDDSIRGISNLGGAYAVRIHDNFIHHNQHDGRLGYGVVVQEGAYALIERNVFDYNRHAVAGDGKPGTGYWFYQNLILPNGGINTIVNHTHQIDMHGRESCFFLDFWCGPAGEYMDLRYNTVLYTKGVGFRLRGTPSIRADVAHNAFAGVPGVTAPPYDQTEGDNLMAWNNSFGLNELSKRVRSCDFDKDGVFDDFMATGANWWYRSSLRLRWVFLTNSNKRVGELQLGDVNGDGRCDVTAGGIVYDGGEMPQRTHILWRKYDGSSENIWQVSGTEHDVAHPPVALPGSLSGKDVLGSGDFDGDGDSDVFMKSQDGNLWVAYTQHDTFLPSQNPGNAEWVASGVTGTLEGTGDFDNDGYDDVLWRLTTGELSLWHSARAEKAEAVTWQNAGVPTEARWKVKAVADFNNDRYADILWMDTWTGRMTVWTMRGAKWQSDIELGSQVNDGSMQFQGVADFDADGYADILWRVSTAFMNYPPVSIWLKGSSANVVYPNYGAVPDYNWYVAGLGDFNGDGSGDILWRSLRNGIYNGEMKVWYMAGGFTLDTATIGYANNSWKLETLLPMQARKGLKVGQFMARIPDLTGLTVVQARTQLQSSGLLVGQQILQEDPTCNNIGVVMGQSPNPGNLTPPGTSIKLYIGIKPAPPKVCF